MIWVSHDAGGSFGSVVVPSTGFTVAMRNMAIRFISKSSISC